MNGTIRDRVKELRRVRASDLQDNTGNWRLHPAFQRDALRAVLEEVGIAGALTAYHSPRNHGALTLIDGHLRKDAAPGTEWPCLILDVTDAEADKLLATLDPLSALAETNGQALQDLLDAVIADTHTPDLRSLLTDLEHQAQDAAAAPDTAPDPAADDDLPDGPPEMALQPFEHYDYIALFFRNSNDFARACQLFGIQREAASVPGGAAKIGLGRVIDGRAVLEQHFPTGVAPLAPEPPHA